MALLPNSTFATSRRRVGRGSGLTENIVPERRVPQARAGQANFDASAIGRGMSIAAEAEGRAGQQLGQAVSNIGGVAQDISNKLEAQRLKQEEFDLRRRLQEFEFEQSQNLTTALQGVEPGDVGGVQGNLDGAFTPRAQELMKGIGDPAHQQFADNEITKIYNRLSGAATKFAVTEQLRVNEQAIADHLNSVLAGEAGAAGVGLDDYKNIERKLHGIIVSTPGLSPIDADKTWRKYGHELLQHYIQGNPNKAAALLAAQGDDAPETAKFLTLTDRKAIRSGITSAVTADLETANDFLAAGMTIPDNIQAKLLSYSQDAAGAKMGDIATALRVSAVTADAQSRSPGELQDRITELYASKIDTPEKLEVVQAYEKVFGRLKSAIDDGGLLDYAAKSGRFPVTDIDVENPYSMVLHKQNALAIADFYGTAPQFTNEGQRMEISALLNDDTKTATERVATMEQLASGLGQDVFAEIADKKYAPMMAHAGALASMGRSDIAREIVQGQTAIAEGRGGPGDKSEFDVTFSEATEGAFATAAAQGQASLIYKAAKAVYAARQGTVEDVNAYDEAVFRNAIEDVLGTRQTDQGQVGGIGSFQSNGIILPNDLTQTQFRDIIDGLKDEDLIKVSTSVPPGSMAGINRTPLAPVHANGTPMTAKDLREFYLISVGNGEYEVSWSNPRTDPPRLVRAEGSNKPWRMRIDAGLLQAPVIEVDKERELDITSQKRARVTKATDFRSSDLGRKLEPSGISLP